MLRQQAQKGRLGDAALARQGGAHFAGSVTSHELSQFIRREAIGDTVAPGRAVVLDGRSSDLPPIDAIQGVANGRELSYFVAGTLRVACKDPDQRKRGSSNRKALFFVPLPVQRGCGVAEPRRCRARPAEPPGPKKQPRDLALADPGAGQQ
jgi:hypothetical protein